MAKKTPSINIRGLAGLIKQAQTREELGDAVSKALAKIQEFTDSIAAIISDLENTYSNPTSNSSSILVDTSHLSGDIQLKKLLPYGSATVQAIAAVTDKIIPLAATVRVANTTAGAITLTSTPTIPNGSAWQEITVRNSGTKNIVLQDRGTLANSNLAFEANTRTLAPRQSITLQYDLDIGMWCEKYYSAVL